MRGKLFTIFSIFGAVACGIYGCPYNRTTIFQTDYLTEEQANEIFSNYNTTEAIANIDTLYFIHSIYSLGYETSTITYIDFNKDSLYYYEYTTVTYEDPKTYNNEILSVRKVVLENDLLSIQETDLTTGIGTSTESIVADMETTFEEYSNNVLSNLVYNEDTHNWMKECATDSITYFRYGNGNLRVGAYVEETTDSGSFSGYVDINYNVNGLLTYFSYSADQQIEDETTYFHDYYSCSYDLVT